MTLPGYTPPSDSTALAQVFAEIRTLADAVADATIDYRAGGSVSVPAGTGGVNVNVVFSTPMPATPAVLLTVNHPSLKDARVTSQSTTGFTARFDRDSSASYWFNWLAVIPK